jgi:hypothetical protein
MRERRTRKRRQNKKKKGGCASCGKAFIAGGCQCNKNRNLFGGKKTKKRGGGADCGCGASYKLRGGSGFIVDPTSKTFSSELMYPIRNQANDMTNPNHINSERLIGGRKRRMSKRRMAGGGDPLLGQSAPANMVLNSGTSIGAMSMFNGLNATTNMSGAPYSQPNLKTTIV